MMSMSPARRAMPSSRMRAPSFTSARMQRSTIHSGEITCSQRPHGHTEVIERLVHRFNACSFLDQKLGLAAVGTEHAIPHKTAAVAHQNPDLAEFPGKLHTGCNHFFAAVLAAH